MRISNSSTSMSSTLAPRAAASVALGKKMEMLIHMTSDTWDPKTNPDGYINLGVAENVCTVRTVNSSVDRMRMALANAS